MTAQTQIAAAWRRLRRWWDHETDTRRYDRTQGALVQHGLYTVAGVDYAPDYDDVGGLLRALNRPGVLPPEAERPGVLLREVDHRGNFVHGGRVLAGGYVISGDGRLRSVEDIIKGAYVVHGDPCEEAGDEDEAVGAPR